MNKRIMILGAGVYQVPLIKRAKEMGLETLVVSPKGQYPGIPLADIFLDIDTTDADQIVVAARQHAISGIVTTGSDVSVPAMGAVADALGLRGPTRRMAETVSSKTRFRAFLKEKGFNFPDFAVCRSSEDAVEFGRAKGSRTVLKPDDSSGSRGVTVLESDTTASCLAEAYSNARSYSRSGLVCAEEFLPGTEVGGDAFLIAGVPAFFVTTCKHMEGVLVRSHSLPGRLSDDEKTMVREEIVRIASALGYTDGPMNFDVMVSESSATAIEVGLRNGGNGILDLIDRSYGVNLHRWLLGHALGEPFATGRFGAPCAVSSYVFGSPVEGVLKRVPRVDEMRSRVPEVLDVILARNVGDRVEAFIHNASLVGYLLLDCDATDYAGVSSRVREVLNLEVVA